MVKRIALLAMLLLTGIAHATVTGTASTASFSCTGSTGPFPFTFPVLDVGSLRVIEIAPGSLPGIMTVLASSAWTASPVNNSYANGGLITLNATCPSGYTLTIARVTEPTQLTNYTPYMPALYQNFENNLDQLTTGRQDTYRVDQVQIGQISGPGAATVLYTPLGQYLNLSFPTSGVNTSYVSDVPSGAVNGTNRVFTLSTSTCVPNSFLVWVNYIAVPNAGYTLSGPTVTFSTPPQPGDLLAYQCAVDVGGAVGLVSTTQTTPQSLSGPLNIPIGMPGSPTTSNSNPPIFVNVYDNGSAGPTSVCSGLPWTGIGGGSLASEFCHTEYGDQTGIPIYALSSLAAGSIGFGGGESFNVVAQPGSNPQQLFHNFLLADNSGWTINSCTLTSGVDVCSTTAPILMSLSGAGLYISGNSVANTGGGICVISSYTSSSFTCTNTNQSGSGGPVSGGHVTGNHLVFTFETNAFNNAHDPLPVGPTTGQVVLPFWGIVSTSTGNFPTSANFFSDGPTYEGFLSQNASDADFVAGFPSTTGGTLASTTGFRASEMCEATSGNNCQSKAYQFNKSVWNGSASVNTSDFIELVPATNATNAPGQLKFITPSATAYITDQAMWNLPNGSATSPAYSFTGGSNTGMYLDGGGCTGIANNGAEKLSVCSSSVTVTNTLSVQSGSNIVLRCTTAGTLPVGALTITAGDCGASSDTGLRVN